MLSALLLSSVLAGAETTNRSRAVIVGLATPDRTVKHCSSPFFPAPKAAILAPAVSREAGPVAVAAYGTGAFRRECRLGSSASGVMGNPAMNHGNQSADARPLRGGG